MIYNKDAEQAVIGALLIDNDAFDRLDGLKPEHFYQGDHQAIFKSIETAILSGKPADVITIGETHDLAYLHNLATNTPSSANIRRYADLVKESFQRRELALMAGEITELSKTTEDPTRIIDLAQSALEKITENKTKSEPIRVSDDLSGYIDDFDRRYEGQGEKVIPTGFVDLDKKMMGGFRRGELWIVAARPKMGKTAFSLNVALNVSFDHSALFLSMEMPRRQIHDRNIAVMGRIDLPRVLVPKSMESDDWPKLTHAVQGLQDLNLFIDDQGALRLTDVRTKARQVKRKHGLDLLIIDYLQLMDGEGDNRNAQIEAITRGLKALAKEMDIAIVLLSQLNRGLEQRPNKRPMPSDLRDSGAIEQDCDGAIFLYRDEVYNPNTMDKGICEANVGLIRQGEPGVVGLTYIGHQTRFENLGHGVEFGRMPEKRGRGGLVD